MELEELGDIALLLEDVLTLGDAMTVVALQIRI
jgi:hypothetical protein